MARRIAPIFVTALSLLFGAAVVRADTYTVTNTNTTGPGSLAQAIVDSNAHNGQDTVAFNIPGTGVHRIDLSGGPLPEISDSLIVDGYTQPGAHPNTLSIGDDAVILIHLDGGASPAAGNGLTITGSNCLVRGLSITGFSVNSNPDNLAAPTTGFGIFLKGPGTGNVVQGNFIGVKPDGITVGRNLNGVRVYAAQSTVGGAAQIESRNVISGNNIGVGLYSGTATGMLVAGNYIGTDATGTHAVGNGLGIALGTTDTLIGGTAPLSGNLISGNLQGISLGASYAYHITGPGDRALVQGNQIGTTADGSGPLGNGTGIYFVRAPNSTIGGLDAGAGNVIAYNTDGIIVRGTGNSILSNSIYGNSGRGIILDSGANNGQSAPVITSEDISNGIATVSGTLVGPPNNQFRVQLFADSQSLTTSIQTFIGSIGVNTDSSGHGSFTVSFPFADENVVFNATATVPTSPNGSTSEFSRNAAYLQNLSARATVGTGGDALIGGLIVGGYGEIAVRGIGPSLKAFGINDALADPTLEFRNSTGRQMFDDNWKDNQTEATLLQQKGLAPSDDLESGLMPFSGPPSPFAPDGTLTQYTATLRGKADTTGTGVIEVYGMASSYDSDFFAKLSNLSARGLVGANDKVIVGGFIIGGGEESTRVVLRAIGPSLQSSGVTNPLPDPVLELHDSNGSTLTSNDNWEQSQAADLQTVGLAPVNPAESAILTRLTSGAYTAVVRGKGSATGVALVEIYRLP